MTPTFTLPRDWTEREVEFVLSRAPCTRRGWQFYGHHDGTTFPARNARGDILLQGRTFATKADAAIMARALGLPAYAVWNGHKRAYDGTGATFTAHARN